MKAVDVLSVHALLTEKLESYKVAPTMSPAEVSHWMLPRKGVVYSYVVENENNVITDFASFYSLPSSVLGNERHKTLFAAYQFWTCAKSVSLSDLTNDMFVMAKEEGFDVFNALDLMENLEIFETLKFGIGDGLLHYYLYNWSMAPFRPNELGLILL
jgi:glycylpeptide N-tetradecanoyltransferase